MRIGDFLGDSPCEHAISSLCVEQLREVAMVIRLNRVDVFRLFLRANSKEEISPFLLFASIRSVSDELLGQVDAWSRIIIFEAAVSVFLIENASSILQLLLPPRHFLHNAHVS